MSKFNTTAQSAFDAQPKTTNGRPVGANAKFVCPYDDCRTYAVHLGATKKGIDAAIGELVGAGTIKTPIQRALDTVRVIGNESVHPGEMNLKDDRETALTLFRIINLIVETAITEPKRLDELYASLPQSKLDGIAQRDAATQSQSNAQQPTQAVSEQGISQEEKANEQPAQ